MLPKALLFINLFLVPVLVAAQFTVDAQPRESMLRVVWKMKETLESIRDYSCEVEQTYYTQGDETIRYRFKFSFKTGKKIRIKFVHPYSGLVIYYSSGREDVTVVPFPFFSFFKINFSLDNPMIRTPTGQRVDQTDMGYFMKFLMRNLTRPIGATEEYEEREQEVVFSFRAMDYLENLRAEHYRITVSKSHWMPVRIERYSQEGTLIERSIIKDYLINQGLTDRSFEP